MIGTQWRRRNRRGFYRSVRDMISAAVDDGLNHLCVAMVDLDRFNVVNDTRGHAVGDQLLVAIAECLRSATGAHAIVARVGGEEFLVAEVVAHDRGIDEMAERLRTAVASLPWNVTASVGVACAACTADGATRKIVGDIVAAADAAMYAAKRDGGNQFRSATTIH